MEKNSPWEKSSFIIFLHFSSKGKQHSLPKSHTFSSRCLMCIAKNNVLGPPCSACAAESEQTSGRRTLGKLQVAKSSFARLGFLELGTTDSWKICFEFAGGTQTCWSGVSQALLSNSCQEGNRTFDSPAKTCRFHDLKNPSLQCINPGLFAFSSLFQTFSTNRGNNISR